MKGGINCRFMYAKVSEAQKKEICRALKEKKKALPEDMEEGILYDLKFV